MAVAIAITATAAITLAARSCRHLPRSPARTVGSPGRRLSTLVAVAMAMAMAMATATAIKEPALAPSFLVPSILPRSGQIV